MVHGMPERKLEDNLVWKIVNSLEIHQMELLMNDLDIV
jgi:hypothetical protein